jgi:hypothetical protein
MEHVGPAFLPLLEKPVTVPPVLMGDGSEQLNGERVELKLFQDAVDEIGPFTLMYTMESITGGIDRQRWHIQPLAIGRENRDPGCDAKAKLVDPTQLLHNVIYLPGLCSPWI